MSSITHLGTVFKISKSTQIKCRFGESGEGVGDARQMARAGFEPTADTSVHSYIYKLKLC